MLDSAPKMLGSEPKRLGSGPKRLGRDPKMTGSGPIGGSATVTIRSGPWTSGPSRSSPRASP
eukprot:3271851-Lingulodinium_polyedra.AAC.1